ncbi:MAG: hypothetical protein F6K09_39345 [Merismopedia sp. SIO2A8]|nr:hypothetical protein [Symploca sp. SIO2B6]NET54431.1 hypothetical protein [Merismopedia sp. SIO2A8]
MSIELDRTDFQQLVRIIQNLPEFETLRDRRRLLVAALAGVPQVDTILARLDLETSPMSASVEVVRFLCKFGKVAYGKEALGVFLNHIQNLIGDVEERDFITDLFGKYPLNNFEVVAIHHSGGMLTEPGTKRRYERNAGSSMIAVLEDLKAHAPQIYARLER